MIKMLIEKVKFVKFRYDKVNRIIVYDFNIFSMLRIGYLEILVYLRFLFFLLDLNEIY